MKRISQLAGVLFLGAAIAMMSFKGNGEEEGLPIGAKLPHIEKHMPGVDGSNNSLGSYAKENGLIIVFSCNTCPFVVGSETFAGWEVQYNDLAKAAEKANIGFILVNSNEAKRDGDDSMEEMKAHAKAEKYKMPYVLDMNHVLADAVGAKTTPHVYAFDKKMQLSYKGSIDNSWDTKREKDIHYLNEVIASFQAGTPVAENSTPPRGCSIKRVKN